MFCRILKNFCPIRIGDILLTSSTENPTSYYFGTTWELLPDNKFLKTGSTPLQQAGSNSVKISKTNLPAEKLQVESFSLTTQPHTHMVGNTNSETGGGVSWYLGNGRFNATTTTSSGGGANTGTASPSTQNMGSGTPISINPEHITIKAWKRLS